MGGILLIFEPMWWTYNVIYSILSTSQFFFLATPYSMQVFSSPTRYQTCGRVKSLLLDHQGSPSTLPKYFYYFKKKKKSREKAGRKLEKGRVAKESKENTLSQDHL